MRRLNRRSVYRSLLLLILCCGSISRVSAQTGDVSPVHDPSIIESGDKYYIFSTGRGLSIRSSTDLFNWTRDGRVFNQVPAWTQDYSRNSTYFWAPDISFSNNEYRVYYAVSSFGKTLSAIGLVVNKTLDRSSADYKWIDRGKVIETPAGNNWNAIDPCAFEDTDGNAWLVLGSCWTGIKLVALDAKTGLQLDATQRPLSLAAHPPTNIIEEGYIRRHGDFYYLWESVDHCCRGVDSNYRILVGRSKTVRGPYLDFDGKPMTQGGGTLVLASYGDVRGPGSCAITQAAGHDYLIHHEYDANNFGRPRLQIRELFYTADGWPMVGEPVTRPPTEKSFVIHPVTGAWDLRYDFGTPHPITLQDDGALSPTSGRWHMSDNKLILNWTKPARTLVEECVVADDGTFFVGRTSDGTVITSTRTPTTAASGTVAGPAK